MITVGPDEDQESQAAFLPSGDGAGDDALGIWWLVATGPGLATGPRPLRLRDRDV